ncbi:MAG TPA: hypothetical protein VFD92_04745 [Candidatus Binatia bacterium]|nr:hypothetical protein [Candidatus Binatia bacterium]
MAVILNARTSLALTTDQARVASLQLDRLEAKLPDHVRVGE